MYTKLVVFLAFVTLGVSFATEKTPLINTTNPQPEVVNYQDAGLQLALQDQINANAQWKNLIQQKRMSVSLVDMTDENNIKYANINGDNMMYAASMPKIAVLYAAIDAVEEGDLRLTKKVQNDMWLMINKSNNAASTRMIDRVGFQRIEDLMCNPENPFYDKEGSGGLWVGKRYAAQGKRNPEPIRGLSHAATTDAVAKFYYQLATGQLINKKRSAQMLKYLKNPGLHHKFVNTLDVIAPEATLYRKSGSWKNWHCDSIMVVDEARGKKYILVAMVEDSAGEQIIRDLVKPAEIALDQSATLAPDLEENEITITTDS